MSTTITEGGEYGARHLLPVVADTMREELAADAVDVG
jgi:hypothetical protein